MEKPSRIITRFPLVTIVATLAVTFYFALQLPNLRFEEDQTDVYLPEDHPAKAYADTVKEIFN